MKMQAKVELWSKKQCNYAMNAFMKCANAKLLQSSNVKTCSITLVCVHMDPLNTKRAPLLNKNGWSRLRGKRFDQGWSLKVGTIHVHKYPPMRKKKALTFESGEWVEENYSYFKIKNSSRIGNCALKCRGKKHFYFI